MNAPLAYRPEDEQLLDRLVDGELTEPERRQLLLRLESEGDGWRRCALAFLEAQAWGREFRQVARDPASWVGPQPAEKPSIVRRPFFGSRFGAGLAMAASFLLAFSLGQLYRDWDAGRGAVRGGGLLAKDNSQRPETAGNVAPAPKPRIGLDESDGSLWHTVYLPVDEDQDGVPEPVQVPLYDGPGVERLLANQAGGLPASVIEALQRRGHKVQQNREFMPVQLEDGRQAIVPVDQVEVQFAQHRTYQ